MRLGIDIGGTKTDAVALDATGRVVERVRMATGFGPDAVVEVACAVADRLAAALGDAVHPFDAVGVGVPGLVEPGTGRVQHAVNLGVSDLPLADLLSVRLGVAVTVENDVNAAALGAYHLLGEERSMGFLNLGTGLAAGIVVGGRLWRGARGAAGELGHLPVDPRGARCACGQVGCIETLASGSAVARMWPTSAELPAVDLFDRAERGEREAVEVRDRLADGVAAAVRALMLTADVDTVAIGGGLSNLGERLHREVAAALQRSAAHSAFLASLELPTRVRLVPPGTAIAAVGAALATDTEETVH